MKRRDSVLVHLPVGGSCQGGECPSVVALAQGDYPVRGQTITPIDRWIARRPGLVYVVRCPLEVEDDGEKEEEDCKSETDQSDTDHVAGACTRGVTRCRSRAPATASSACRRRAIARQAGAAKEEVAAC